MIIKYRKTALLHNANTNIFSQILRLTANKATSIWFPSLLNSLLANSAFYLFRFSANLLLISCVCSPVSLRRLIYWSFCVTFVSNVPLTFNFHGIFVIVLCSQALCKRSCVSYLNLFILKFVVFLVILIHYWYMVSSGYLNFWKT